MIRGSYLTLRRVNGLSTECAPGNLWPQPSGPSKIVLAGLLRTTTVANANGKTPMNRALSLILLLLAAPTPADTKPNNSGVPDAYAITGHFDRIVVMRMKFKTDVLHGMEKLVKQEHIQNGVILSGIGSLRGFHVHQINNRDFPTSNIFTNEPNTPCDLVSMNGYIVHGVIHAHMTLGTGEKAFAGHLEPGTEVFTYAIITVGVIDKDLGRIDDKTYR
jgi:predicted DNA-binding protein with PD1-like motif